MRTLFVILFSAVIILFNCTNSSNPLKQQDDNSYSVQTVNDTIISYGSYPDLPNRLNVRVNNKIIKQVNVDWDHSINIVIPGTYIAVGRYSLAEFGGENDSIFVRITISPCDSIERTDTLPSSLGYGYDTAGKLMGVPLLPEDMTVHEKPINNIQYIYKVIQTEESRILFKKNIDSFLGFSPNICNDPLQSGKIKIVTGFIFRYNSQILDGDLVFSSKLSDSLYRANPDEFKSLWGSLFSQQVTLCRFYLCEDDLTPESLTAKELSDEILNLDNSLSLQSTTKIDLSNFSLQSTTKIDLSNFSLQSTTKFDLSKFSLPNDTSISTLPGRPFTTPWYYTKSPNQFYNEFKNAIDSCMSINEYYESYNIRKSFY